MLPREKARFTAPVVYSERRGNERSGWLHYLDREHAKTTGTHAHVTVGAAGAPLGAKSSGLIVAPAQMAATRTAVSSAEANAVAHKWIGSIGDAQVWPRHHLHVTSHLRLGPSRDSHRSPMNPHRPLLFSSLWPA